MSNVTRCRCRRRRCRRGHRCAGGVRQYRWRHLVNWRAAARSGEWAQHFSNASCLNMQWQTYYVHDDLWKYILLSVHCGVSS